ncbi:hypothetical protein AVEN_143702-1 [Araneus ventricosus]|uniref:Uncharacterized protein n=1 Tax=Araneus ventricosus TaxID=182803 RepID=A0A4Y2APH5_ARAVE|nr:hypothetical protein AVEN_143702-1 [Araneus ventricosus]
MRSRNSTQKHSSVKNGKRFQKSSTFIERQCLKNVRNSTRLWTDDEIVSQTISSPLSDEEEEDVPVEPNITAAQAKNAVDILQRFMECSENVEKEDFAAIFRIEKLGRKAI